MKPTFASEVSQVCRMLCVSPSSARRPASANARKTQCPGRKCPSARKPGTLLRRRVQSRSRSCSRKGRPWSRFFSRCWPRCSLPLCDDGSNQTVGWLLASAGCVQPLRCAAQLPSRGVEQSQTSARWHRTLPPLRPPGTASRTGPGTAHPRPIGIGGCPPEPVPPCR